MRYLLVAGIFLHMSCEVKLFRGSQSKSTSSDLVAIEVANEGTVDLGEFPSCRNILESNPEAASGVYSLLITYSNQQRLSMEAYCDMVTDGGGWTLILNYVHKEFTNPNDDDSDERLPLMSEQTLGADESESAYWGHAEFRLAAAIPATEMRFFCQSSAHDRTLHFITTGESCLQYTQRGLGSCAGIETEHRLLEDHSANLPAAANEFEDDRQDDALLREPFASNDFSWTIGKRGDRWACDDDAGDYSQATIHRVWLR
ncbi:MAG: hypothetical protein HRU19_22350 [Pseudobacteriovorax sp.]|nr:hypothetical protein [Pseudobacteriovorax sp.]